MSEVPPNSTTIGYLMTALYQKHQWQTFPLRNSPARLSKDKESKNLASIDDGDTTQRGGVLGRLVFSFISGDPYALPWSDIGT